MAWLQLLLDVDPVDAQLLSEQLDELGAIAVTLEDAADQPLYEPPPGTTPLWNHTRVIALFTAVTDLTLVVARLQALLAPKSLPAWRIQTLEDKNWEREWIQHFHPLQIGRRVWICPSWCAPPDPDAVNILLDPGLAFGTGTHPTTALCLEWLDHHGAEHDRVIDYGCGSGILAVTAAKLGARKVYATDIDPQALIATRSNAENNGVSGLIETCLPEAMPQQPCQLLLANILAGPLLELGPRFADLVAAGGLLVLSGLLQAQARDLTEAYGRWFDMDAPATKEDWVRLSGRRH
jgi:ribosomal protein L11 methyltransferase